MKGRMNTESGEVGKREDGRRRDQVNRQRLPVPYIFLWHLQHRKQHLLHAATWLYLANSHTAISYAPALYSDPYAFPKLFYLIPLPLLLQSLPFFFIFQLFSNSLLEETTNFCLQSTLIPRNQ